MQDLLEKGKLKPTSDPKDLLHTDVKIISVPTPLDKKRAPDLSVLLKAAAICGKALEHSQLVVVQSTSFPGTTEEEVLPILEKESKLKAGKDFFLAHVPEREDAGNPDSILSMIPRICGGLTKECLLLAKTLYEHITSKVYPCSSAKVAEATKTFENTYRLINIAFVDEMKITFDRMGINMWEVIEAASTKPFGYSPFYPGPGIGGECIPVDPIYLACKARQYRAPTAMIDIASTINEKTAHYVVEKISEALGQRKKKLKKAKILILGVAFKKDVSDTRESPAFKIISLLEKKGAEIAYHDFFVPELPLLKLKSISLDQLSSFDCVVIIADHSQYDWNKICKESQLIVDTRNATKHIDPDLREKVIL